MIHGVYLAKFRYNIKKSILLLYMINITSSNLEGVADFRCRCRSLFLEIRPTVAKTPNKQLADKAASR